MHYAAVISVDNAAEDPDTGRRGLRDELLPALRTMPGFVSANLLTDHSRGRGIAVVVFETSEDAARLANSVNVGDHLRDGVTVTASEVLEVAASS